MKKKNSRAIRPIDTPIPPVPVNKFKFCFQSGGAAADGRDSSFEFDTTPVDVPELGVSIVFTDNPLNRFLQSIRPHCSSQNEYRAMGQRLIAFLNLIPHLHGTPLVREKTEKAPDETISEIAIELAATFPLRTKTGEFEHEVFIDIAIKRFEIWKRELEKKVLPEIGGASST